MDDLKFISKLKKFFENDIKNIKNISILEFGVKNGNSTKFFLDICEKNNGKLFSVDIEDCSHLFANKKWKFIHCSDDNFEKVINESQNEFDVIYIDSLHQAKHVKKLIHYYFNHLKKNGIIVVDDISWIPYTKNNYRDNFHNEINNKETFLEILNIYFNNRSTVDVFFSFEESGLSKIVKHKNEKLNFGSNLISREHSIKNFVRKIFLQFK